MEYLIALIPAVAWGSIGIIAKKMGGNTEQQTIGSMTGFMFLAIITYIIKRPVITSGVFLVGFISGVLLAIANFGQFDSMTSLGVSTAVPLVASGQLSVNMIVAASIFREWTEKNQWMLGIFSLALIIIGAKFTSYEEKERSGEKEGKKFNKTGVIGLFMAIFAGAFYSIVPKGYQYFMGVDGGNNYVQSLILPQAIGGLLGAYVIYLLRKKKSPFREYKTKATIKNMNTGFAWAIGNMALLRASTGSLGLATAFTFSQLNLLVGGIGGIVILKEEKSKKEKIHFGIGLALVLFGAILTSRI